MRNGWKKVVSMALAFAVVLPLFSFAACGGREETDYEFAAADYSDKNASELEALAPYSVYYLPSDGSRAGDIMPLYEDGVYRIFYLKDGGGSSSHPVYRVDTTDFVHYEDKGLALDAGGSNSGEAMIGTGTVLKKGSDYYFFYTGHPSSGAETVRLAVSSGNLDNFVKQTDFTIEPSDYGFEDDFRDPEVFWDEEQSRFTCIIATRQAGQAVLALFYIDEELNVEFSTILYRDTHGYNMLECPDFFELDGVCYLTYSAQDLSLSGDTDGTANSSLALTGGKGSMYYLRSDSLTGEWTETGDTQLDSAVFYAGKVAFGSEPMLIGWSAQKSVNPGYDYEWGGNIVAHTLLQNEDGSLSLGYPKSFAGRFDVSQPLLLEENALTLISSSGTFNGIAEERLAYRLSMKVNFTSDTQSFGLVFGLKDDMDNVVKVTINPSAGKIKAQYGSNGEMASRYLSLSAGTDYRLDVFVEGSNYVLYIEGVAFTFRVRNAGNKKIALFAQDGMVTFSDISMLAPSESDLDGTGSAVLAAGESLVFSATATRDAYMSAFALLNASGTVSVQMLDAEGNAVAESEGSGNLSLYGYADTRAGGTFTVLITAQEAAEVSYAVDGAQTHYVPDRDILSREASSRGAQISASEDGYVSYYAIVKLSAATEGAQLVIGKNGETVACVSAENGYAFLQGTVEASSGDALSASVDFSRTVCSYEVLLVTYGGAEAETNILPMGVNERAYSNGLGVEISSDRTNNASVAQSFGEQGTNGFVYTYGRSIDEMKAISVFNNNSDEAYNYKYIETSASSDIEVKADWAKTGDRYMVGATYVAATDGEIEIDLSLWSVEASGGFMLVQVYLNRSRLTEAIVKSGDGWSYREKITVSAGDCVIFGIKNVGYMTDLGTASANYSFAVSEPRSSDFSDWTKAASFTQDFNSDPAADSRWTYGYVRDYFAYENTELHYTAFESFDIDKWSDSAISGIEIKSGWLMTENNEVDAAIGYKVSETGRYAAEINFIGSNAEETRVTARIVVVGEDGSIRSAEYIGDGKEGSNWYYSNFNLDLQEGDTVYLIFFREGGLGYYHGAVEFNLFK